MASAKLIKGPECSFLEHDGEDFDAYNLDYLEVTRSN